jgi:dihydroorotate dehydrogenase electron transfer subunit
MPVDVEARVIRNTRLSSDYNVIALAAPDIASAVAPGQFVMIKSHHGHDPLLRRPFSVFEILRTNGRVDGLTLLSKRVGVTTSMLFDAVEGDVVSCLGPLGCAFETVRPPTEAWMVAGGVGLAPFATLSEALRAQGASTTLFYGARSSRELFYLEWFRARGVRLVLSTEDGSTGDRGRVTLPLERELQRAGDTDITVYACGPHAMLKAVATLSATHGRPSQVSVERVMGCGLGGCYSCVVPLRDGHAGHHYIRSCIGGPVFPGSEIVWDLT